RIRKEEPREHPALIVALTANGLREDVERCLAAGMNSHLAKPVSLDALQKALSCDARDLPASFSVR
ncbi:MAG: response regulator, partial [Bryobacterales bacterium]|nr:response regulator [Bryobacterales bacterium]